MKNLKRKRRKKTKKELILEAMKNKNWDYRTVHGIAAETKIPEPIVAKILNESRNEVRSSFIKTKSGKNLYFLRENKSAVGDFWWAIRKMSKDKYEASDDDC
ncbi:hypothetical protein [Marinobacterium stanieri]|uniref:hypothetical protein n=1 Tax=Marinobacterium stanieri TaxID=49186 RepID=UPI0002558F1B|nr:hypothetical protein [Marinobacterium stanieri]